AWPDESGATSPPASDFDVAPELEQPASAPMASSPTPATSVFPARIDLASVPQDRPDRRGGDHRDGLFSVRSMRSVSQVARSSVKVASVSSCARQPPSLR